MQAVYTGAALNRLTLIAANDDANGGTFLSQLTFTATQNVTYHFVVDGFNNRRREWRHPVEPHHDALSICAAGLSSPSRARARRGEKMRAETPSEKQTQKLLKKKNK